MAAVEYDQEADALYVYVGRRRASAKTKKLSPGVFADYDKDGEIVGVEILRASEKVLANVANKAARRPRLMTLAEAERHTGLSAITLRSQIRNGRIRATKKGRDWLVGEDAIEEYLESRNAPKNEYTVAGG